MPNDNILECRICGEKTPDWLGDHLVELHGIAVQDYLEEYPGAPVASARVLDAWKEKTKNVRRSGPPAPDKLVVDFGKYQFGVNWDVPESACLPMPPHYRVPTGKGLGEDIAHALVALKKTRSIYVWGLPGSGKDALFHAWSAATRTPAVIRQIKPGTDIEAWFFSRAFNDKGTYWEEGELFRALRDGYRTLSGRTIPYLILFTDFDRADREQAERLRLITDSIQGRVDGPGGTTHPVWPGTIIVATANTAGSGDDRGRMISANPIDASILERFQRRFQFRWMEWDDEEPILKAKYPLLAQRVPKVFKQMGFVTQALREAILNGNLYGEFSHRALEAILGHATDIVECSPGKRIPKNLLKVASRAWIDGLPDEENRKVAIKIMDPHFGTLSEGDTSHISDDPLSDATA